MFYKISVITTIALLLNSKSFSQVPPNIIIPTENNIYSNAYFVDNNINKFVGTWRWVSGNDTVLIALKKTKRTIEFPPYTYFEDMLYGCNTYIKNGQLVFSTMQFINSPNLSNYNIAGGSNYQDSTKANLIFGDRPKKRRHNLILQFIAGTPNKLSWHTNGREGACIEPCPPPGFTLPRDMILTKQ